jgi:hypothetical protein
MPRHERETGSPRHRQMPDLAPSLRSAVREAIPVTCLESGEPKVGFEPTTYSLRMNCSTPELLRRLVENDSRLICDNLAVKRLGEAWSGLAELGNEEAEALADVVNREQCLALVGVADEMVGEQVC